jgi:hypothetical protein
VPVSASDAGRDAAGYVLDMAGCARPTCDAPAEVGLGYDAVGRVAWLVSLDGSTGRDLLVLCTRHADRVTLPVGWVGRDDRTGQPTLWLPAAGPPTGPRPDGARSAAPARRNRARNLDEAPPADELPLWADRLHDPASHLAEQLYREHDGAAPRPPRAAPSDEEHPHSPLLARAFRAAGLG